MERKEGSPTAKIAAQAGTIRRDPIALETGSAAARIVTLLKEPVKDQAIQDSISQAVLGILGKEFRKLKRLPTVTVASQHGEHTTEVRWPGLSIGTHTMVILNRPLTLPAYLLLTPRPTIQMCEQEVLDSTTRLRTVEEDVFEREDSAKKGRLAMKALYAISLARRQEQEASKPRTHQRVS